MIKKKIATAFMAAMMVVGSIVPAYAAIPSYSWGGSWSGSWGDIIGSGSSQVKLTAPTGVTVVNTACTSKQRSMKLTWDKVEGATKYIIQESNYEDFHDMTEIETTNTYLNRTFKNTSNSPYYGPSLMPYYYRVKAVSGSSESAWSEVVVCEPTK